MISQSFSHLPVPVGTGTIADSIPNSQNKPGKSGYDQCDEIGQSGFLPYPAYSIKQGESRMKYKEENI